MEQNHSKDIIPQDEPQYIPPHREVKLLYPGSSPTILYDKTPDPYSGRDRRQAAKDRLNQTMRDLIAEQSPLRQRIGEKATYSFARIIAQLLSEINTGKDSTVTFCNEGIVVVSELFIKLDAIIHELERLLIILEYQREFPHIIGQIVDSYQEYNALNPAEISHGIKDYTFNEIRDYFDKMIMPIIYDIGNIYRVFTIKFAEQSPKVFTAQDCLKALRKVEPHQKNEHKQVATLMKTLNMLRERLANKATPLAAFQSMRRYAPVENGIITLKTVRDEMCRIIEACKQGYNEFKQIYCTSKMQPLRIQPMLWISKRTPQTDISPETLSGQPEIVQQPVHSPDIIFGEDCHPPMQPDTQDKSLA